MSAAAPDAERPRIVRSSAGRVRIHLPAWNGSDPSKLGQALQRIPGVSAATARPQTRNVLIEFDPARVEQRELLLRAGSLLATAGKPPAERAALDENEPGTPKPPKLAAGIAGVLREGAGRFGRARIAVRGIDRDPVLARRVVAILERRPEVRRAALSATTGRVLVEFSERVSSIQDLLADLGEVELPSVPGEDRPAHPLDPAPVIQSSARVIGSALGLGWVALQRALSGPAGGAGARAPAAVAGALGIVEGAPPIRDTLRHAMGRDRAQLVLGGVGIFSLALSGSPLGLMVSGAGALRVLTEALARRDAWREYERRLAHVPSAQPGVVVRLDAGARVPLDARVIEGTGTVVRADGLADPVGPNDDLRAGARVLGGPLVVELVGGEPWEPTSRPGSQRPDAMARYMALLGPASLSHTRRIAERAALP